MNHNNISKPRLGEFIFPLITHFQAGNDGTASFNTRAFILEPRITEKLIEGLQKLNTPEDDYQQLIEGMAHLAAINPNNKPKSFAIPNWFIDYQKRKEYWTREFTLIVDDLMASALNNWEMAIKRFLRVDEILSAEEMEPQSVEVLMEMYKFGLI